MTTYLRAAKHTTSAPTDHRVHITGSVLHLAVGVYLPPGTGLLPVYEYVPLCGGRRSPRVEVWRITGTWAAAWAGLDSSGEQTGRGHSHWPVCVDCRRALHALDDAITEQLERHDAHVAQA